MDSTQDTADRPLRIWAKEARELLAEKLASRPPTSDDAGPRFKMDLATDDPAVVRPPVGAGGQGLDKLNLATADKSAPERVKKADALRRQINGVPSPVEATATELLPFDEARQTALTVLDAAPLTEAVLAAAAQELLRLQAAAKSVATAVQQRFQAQVNSTAAPLLDPSLQAPPDAEGAEWDPVKQATGLASATEQELLASDALRSAQLPPLQAQVDAALQARDLALQAIQARLHDAAQVLLAKVAPAAISRVADTNDGEWLPVTTLAADVQAALNKMVLAGDDIRHAEARLLELPQTLRDVRDQVRQRLAGEAANVRIKANLASRETEKQRKGKLATADSFEQKLVTDYLKRLDALTPEKAMTASQLAQAQQVVDEQPVLVANVLALIKARESLKSARDGLHGDVRRDVESQVVTKPAQLAYDKARNDVTASPAADHTNTLDAAVRDAMTALTALELELLKAALRTLSQAAGAEINVTLTARSKELGGKAEEPARSQYGATVKADPELLLLSAQIRNLADTLGTAADYARAQKALPGLAASATRRAQQLQSEQRLSTALVGTASASGKSVEERMTLLRGIRSDLVQLRADVDSVQARACTLPAGERLITELDTLESVVDKAQAGTLEDDCAAWRKKLVSLRNSFDADITSLRVARAAVDDGAKYLRNKSKLYRSGGTPPVRVAVETAIGAPADPGHTLAAWAYTWDQLLAEIRDDLTDGYLTQTALDKLTGGSPTQRYVKAGNNHVSISFTKEDDLYRVTQIHVTSETSANKYFYNVNKGVITAQASTPTLPNPTTGTPATYIGTANNLVAAHKSKFNCK